MENPVSDTAPPTPPLSKAYDPATVEGPIYAMWEAAGYFRPQARRPDADPFCIIVPPPNVTGALHVGHALTTTIEDILIRWHRMLGDDTLLLPGVDHAGIATQNVVEADLATQGLSRHDIGREAFLERVWEWVRRYRGRIADQQRRLGMSCDWDREIFTLDAGPQRAVHETFRDLYAAGKIYRGHRIINWCPSCRTALSDLEVEHQEEPGRLWHVRYRFVDADGHEQDEGVVIATTRPETIPADVAIAVNPGDDRWKDKIGRQVAVPIPGIDRTIPVITDAAVELDFGTGALKITPGHDMLDFEIGERHGLDAISVIDWDGTMTADAGPLRRAGPRHGPRPRRRGPGRRRLPGAGGGARAQRGPLPALRHAGGAVDQQPVVRGRGGPRGQGGRRRPRRRSPHRAGALRQGVPAVDGEHPPLVHQPAALVGTPHPRLVLPAMRRRRHPGHGAAGIAAGRWRRSGSQRWRQRLVRQRHGPGGGRTALPGDRAPGR